MTTSHERHRRNIPAEARDGAERQRDDEEFNADMPPRVPVWFPILLLAVAFAAIGLLLFGLLHVHR